MEDNKLNIPKAFFEVIKLLLVVFIALRACDVISWPWWGVLAPLWVWLGVILLSAAEDMKK